MTLEVTPPGGGEPYEWGGEMWVRVKVAERGGPLEGRELPARVDPADPQKVAVDWAAVEAQGLGARASADGLRCAEMREGAAELEAAEVEAGGLDRVTQV